MQNNIFNTNIRTKIRYGVTHKIAYADVHGIEQAGKREIIQQWMKENGILILFMQETHIGLNVRETKKEYTWFFSGGEADEFGTGREFAGVGIVIK